MKTAKEHAEELLDTWTFGTTAKDQLPDWMWEDFMEKAEAAFQKAMNEARNSQSR